jgi:peptidoglycan/LPS O-acetylase OafA/YrhL
VTRVTADLHRPLNLARGGALDALRFAAAGFITLYHFGAEEAPRALSHIHPVFDRGFLATNFFLILSGYILARTYGPRVSRGEVDVGGFLLRRLARIWPAHLLVLAGFMAVVVAAAVAGLTLNNPDAFRWENLVRQILLVHAWGVGPNAGWNSPSWTLSALVVCYALFQPLWRALSSFPPLGALVVGVGGLALADFVARALTADLYTLPPAFGLGRGLPLFLLGVATARYGMGRPPGPSRAWILGLGGGGVLVITQATGSANFVAMLALAALILAAGTHVPKRASKAVAGAAAISFALFISHQLVGLVWFKALTLVPVEMPEPAAWAAWAAAFPISLAAALLFHRSLDAPIQTRLTARLARIGPTRAAQPAPGEVVHSA